MNTIRFTALAGALIAAAALCVTSDAWAQKKYTISEAPSSSSKYLQEHAIDAGDIPGHQVRIYEIRYEYPKKDLAFGGVNVTETLTRGMSDYTNWSGSYITYSVYNLEDGNKVFSRSTGATQSSTNADGTRAFKYSFIENFIGGTGKFKGIRGQMRGSGERAAGANSLTQQSSGEYWIEE
jgi:hypothetical protein